MRAVRLFLTGDVMTGRGVDHVLPWPCDPALYEPYLRSAEEYVALAEEANGPLSRPVDVLHPWGDALADLVQRPIDGRIVNLETSVTRHPEPEPKGINYRMSPENFACIEAAGIDCCVIANNHVLDWGRAGLIDTLETIEASAIKAPGAGRNLAEATRPAVMPISSEGRLLVYACAFGDSGVPRHWLAGSDRPGVNLLADFSVATACTVRAELETIRQTGDIAIASNHWGSNWGYDIPSSHRDFAHALIDETGIDLVHGHSSHHPRAIEVHHGRLILYGCGDFISDYESISGYESFRDDLVLAYLPVVAGNGTLQGLTMVPFQIRNLCLNRPVSADVEWLRNVLGRECYRFGGSVALDDAGALRLELP